MRNVQWLSTIGVALLFGACATVDPVATPEARQALAPTGKLRVGVFAVNPVHAVKDPASGELKGPAVDLGREMARRIGVPFEPVVYTAIPPLLAGAGSGEWDIAMMGIGPDRAKLVEFTAPYAIVEFAYLLPDASRAAAAGDLDRSGMRIGVVKQSTPDVYLSRTIRHAALVRVAGPGDMLSALKAGQVDAIYGVKSNMVLLSGKLPGSRVLDDRGGEETAVAVPKGREAATAYARRFVESAKREGLVQAAIDKAAVRGVVVAPGR